jgi:hypothetical protein
LEFAVDDGVYNEAGHAGEVGGVGGCGIDERPEGAAQYRPAWVCDGPGGFGLLGGKAVSQVYAVPHGAGELVEEGAGIAQWGGRALARARVIEVLGARFFGGDGFRVRGRVRHAALGHARGGFGESHAQLGEAGELSLLDRNVVYRIFRRVGVQCGALAGFS